MVRSHDCTRSAEPTAASCVCVRASHFSLPAGQWFTPQAPCLLLCFVLLLPLPPLPLPLLSPASTIPATFHQCPALSPPFAISEFQRVSSFCLTLSFCSVSPFQLHLISSQSPTPPPPPRQAAIAAEASMSGASEADRVQRIEALVTDALTRTKEDSSALLLSQADREDLSCMLIEVGEGGGGYVDVFHTVVVGALMCLLTLCGVVGEGGGGRGGQGGWEWVRCRGPSS